MHNFLSQELPIGLRLGKYYAGGRTNQASACVDCRGFKFILLSLNKGHALE